LRHFGSRRLEIAKRSDTAKDFKTLPENATTRIYATMITHMARRLLKILKSNTSFSKRTLSALRDGSS
jgi:hypothetical protein